MNRPSISETVELSRKQCGHRKGRFEIQEMIDWLIDNKEKGATHLIIDVCHEPSYQAVFLEATKVKTEREMLLEEKELVEKRLAQIDKSIETNA